MGVVIFRFAPPEVGDWLVGGPGDALRIADLRGRPQLEGWPPTRADYAHPPGLPSRRLDIPWVSDGAVALSSLGTQFAAALAPHGELLPVDAPDKRYWLFNCTVVLDRSLLPSTEAEWLEEGVRMLELNKPVFDPRVVRDHPVFRIREFATVTFVDASVKNAYDESGLTGLEFDEVWSG